MRNHLVLTVISLAALTALSPGLRSRVQAAAQAPGASSKLADLSGDWTPDGRRGGIGQSQSISDIGGRKRGQEDDIPY